VPTVRQAAASVAMVVASTLLGAAASLALSADSLGAAVTSTPRCTAAGLSVLPNLSAATIVSVTVGTLPATCGGATLQATVNNGVTSAGGSAAIPAGGGSVTVTLGSAPALLAGVEIDIVVVGP
jgi:hypothetical protein